MGSIQTGLVVAVLAAACSSGTTEVFECTGVCSALSLTYTGTCGTSYGTQTSATARCWCK